MQVNVVSNLSVRKGRNISECTILTIRVTVEYIDITNECLIKRYTRIMKLIISNIL